MRSRSSCLMGVTILYSTMSRQGSGAIHVGSLDSSDRVRLFAADSKVVFAEPGTCSFHREGTLFAQPFDTARLRLTEQPVRIADQVPYVAGNLQAGFALSQTGVTRPSHRPGICADFTVPVVRSRGEAARPGRGSRGLRLLLRPIPRWKTDRGHTNRIGEYRQAISGSSIGCVVSGLDSHSIPLLRPMARETLCGLPMDFGLRSAHSKRTTVMLW